MKKLQSKNNDWLVIIAWLIPLFSTIYLFGENQLRALVVILFLTIWLIGYLRSRDKIGFAFVFIFLVAAYNITFRLGNVDLCYKHSIFVNYLCPTLHLVDIFILLAVVVTFIQRTLSALKYLPLFYLPLLLLFIGEIIVHPNLNSIISISRIVLLILLVLLNSDYIKEIKYKVSGLLMGAMFVTLIIQLVIAALQFKLSRDLGLQFLGESNILNGSINSSFVSFKFGEFLRGYGTFPHPNVLAGYAVAISLFSYKFFEDKSKPQLYIFLLAFVISLLSLSRIHIFLSLSFLLIYLVEVNKDILYAFFPIVIERFSSFSIASISVQERWKLFIESMKVFSAKWLQGTGGGEFVRYLPNDIKTVSDISLYQPVHNAAILLLVEYGIFGFPVLAYYFFKIFMIRHKPFFKMFVSVIALLLIGLFDHYLVSLPQGLVILVMLLI